MAFKKPTLKTAQEGDYNFDPVLEVGTYKARIYQVVDLGLQAGSNDYPDPKHKLEIGFELLEELKVDKDGKEVEGAPATFTTDVAYAPDGYMHEKSAMYKLYQAIDPACEIGPEEFLGKLCEVMLIQKKRKSGKNAGKDYSAISAILPMKAKDQAKFEGAGVLDKLFFDLSEPVLDTWAKLSKGYSMAQQDRIKAGLEYATSPLPELLGEQANEPDPEPKAGEKKSVEDEPAPSGAVPPDADADEDDPFA